MPGTVSLNSSRRVVIAATWSGHELFLCTARNCRPLRKLICQCSFTGKDHETKLLEICTVRPVGTSGACTVGDDQVFHSFFGGDLRLVRLLGHLPNHFKQSAADGLAWRNALASSTRSGS